MSIFINSSNYQKAHRSCSYMCRLGINNCLCLIYFLVAICSSSPSYPFSASDLPHTKDLSPASEWTFCTRLYRYTREDIAKVRIILLIFIRWAKSFLGNHAVILSVSSVDSMWKIVSCKGSKGAEYVIIWEKVAHRNHSKPQNLLTVFLDRRT